MMGCCAPDSSLGQTATVALSRVHGTMPPQTADHLKKATKTIIVENNATAQFANLIKLYTGIDIDVKILKYNGLSFAVEELVEKLRDVLA